jgi:membrane associated rhomboid family serine protease
LKQCPKCKSPIAFQSLFQNNVSICYSCFFVVFTETTFRWLVSPSFFSTLDRQIAKSGTPIKPTCLFCRSPLCSFPIADGEEKKQNLQIFSYWKHWFDYHKRGPLELECCSKCQSFGLNSRSFCRLPIDWDRHHHAFREVQRATAIQENSDGFPTEPFQFVGSFVFGIPYLENTPTLEELPGLTYSAVLLVFAVTWKALKDGEVLRTLTLDPVRNSNNLLLSSISYSCVHADWSQFLSNAIVFLVFAPLVEHELKPLTFISMLLVSAFAAGVFHQFATAGAVWGFSGVVTAILVFFCLRFPTSLVGFGKSRFLAPTALLVWIAPDLVHSGHLSLATDNVSFLGHLGGAIVGFLFHQFAPKGPSSALFEKRAKALTDREIAAKNWRSES